MKWKHIEASREARLWITQVIVPIAGVTALIMSDENTKEKVKGLASKAVNKVKTIFKKKESAQ